LLLKKYSDKKKEVEMIMIHPDHKHPKDDTITDCTLLRNFYQGEFKNLSNHVLLRCVPTRQKQYKFQVQRTQELIKNALTAKLKEDKNIIQVIGVKGIGPSLVA
jgi:hypothetical protein